MRRLWVTGSGLSGAMVGAGTVVAAVPSWVTDAGTVAAVVVSVITAATVVVRTAHRALDGLQRLARRLAD